MWIDGHWHARDLEESDKETVKRSLDVAKAAGIDVIAAMSNTKPHLTSLELCDKYLALADACDSDVKFFVHIGLTPDVDQVARAVGAMRLRERIIAAKMMLSGAPEPLLVATEKQQYGVMKTLAKEGFDKVLVVHCEDNALVTDKLYDRRKLYTWDLCRPETAEISAFERILQMAEDVKFKGKLHIAHVSTLEVADKISNYMGALRLSCGVALHHLVFNYDTPDGEHNVWYKCNPPIRSETTRKGLLERLIKGKIPVLESDHAPHSVFAKSQPMPASGIASGLAWNRVVRYLRQQGISEGILADAGFYNALELYGLKVFKEQSVAAPVSDVDDIENVKVEVAPSVPDEPWKYVKRSGRYDLKRLAELQKQYPVDVYSSLK